MSEVAEQLDVHVSTASRLVSGLRAHDLVGAPENSGACGWAWDCCASRASWSPGSISPPTPNPCATPSPRRWETTNVAILDGEAAINVCQAQGRAPWRCKDWVGQQTQLHATSSGKALLAFLPAERRAEILAGPLAAFTGATHR